MLGGGVFEIEVVCAACWASEWRGTDNQGHLRDGIRIDCLKVRRRVAFGSGKGTPGGQGCSPGNTIR